VAAEIAGTLVDSNVLIDILTEDDRWLPWSLDSLADAADRGPVFINPVIFAEVSVRFTAVEDLEEALPARDYRRSPLPWSAAFLAGKAYVDYRRRGGPKTSPLPDFFIGAHAAVDRLVLLTRDATRYRTYFPTVTLIVPA
jgi:predicted nucleic acid-binding protein